jgi:HAD superfamily hydrolase (TIGR01549 family)
MFNGIIFDMDGTITQPVIDFDKLRAELGICQTGDILDVIKDLPEEQVEHINRIIEKHEQYAIDNMSLQSGFQDFYEYCNDSGFKTALITRNRMRNVDALCLKYDLHFANVLTRDFQFIKPSPEPALHILSIWGEDASRCLFIGDYIHDITCGQEAGMKTCFMKNCGHEDFSKESDYAINDFFELLKIIG